VSGGVQIVLGRLRGERLCVTILSPAGAAPTGSAPATSPGVGEEPTAAPDLTTSDQAAKRSPMAVARTYLALTKPRIIELLLVTTVPPMILAAHGMPSLWLIVATLIGGSLAAGSANTINCYVDRDIDAIMHRTRRRPLARAQVTPVEALRFGIVLGVLATLELGFAVNWASAALADVAILFYVFVYTLGLKRRTPSNIVIGGAAGCFPTLIGWSAVTGSIGWPAIILFLVVFLWTPPHFWALALRYKDDYAAAGVPMLPVVATPQEVGRQIVLYTYAMVAASLVLTPVADTGLFYFVVAAVLGAIFIVQAHLLLRRLTSDAEPASMRLFHWSTTYLTLLFAAVAISPFLT
jgi:protoheme IX farnesyltransferase